jgi:hypothetical protein
MTSPQVDAYVQQLRRELRRHFIADPRILEEVRDHLVDAVERARAEDDSFAAEAEAQAIARFGSPELVAAAFVADRTRILHRCLLVAAILAGIAIAYVDARPTWDDAGMTAGAMALVAAALGSLGPARPWRWALAVGLWIPAYALVHTPAPGSIAMFIVLIFPLAGAYLGRTARGALAMVWS